MRGGICVIAGEASGDVQGAPVVRALRAELALRGLSSVPFWGAAGPRLRAEGVEPLVQSEELAVMAFAEIVPRFFRIKDIYNSLLFEMERRQPLAVLLIDYPGFNLRMAKDAFLRGNTVLYHVAPKVWAHGVRRVHALAEFTHLVTSILPFEESFLRRHGVAAHFVGNPLRDAVEEHSALAAEPRPECDSARALRIALVPGSRRSEVERLLPVLLRALHGLCSEMAEPVEGWLPVAPTLSVAEVREILEAAAGPAGIPVDWALSRVRLVPEGMYSVLASADYAWVCSGTATLETAFFGVPMAVAYKMHLLSALVGKCLLKVPWVSLANLCAEREVVPEFLQYQANAQNLVNHAAMVLRNAEVRSRMRADLLALRAHFPLGASRRAAALMASTAMEYLLPEAEKHRRHALRRSEMLAGQYGKFPWDG